MSERHRQEKEDQKFLAEMHLLAYDQRQVEVRVLNRQRLMRFEQERTEQSLMVMRQNMLGEQHVRSVLAPRLVPAGKNKDGDQLVRRDGWVLQVADEDKDRATEVFPDARFA